MKVTNRYTDFVLTILAMLLTVYLIAGPGLLLLFAVLIPAWIVFVLLIGILPVMGMTCLAAFCMKVFGDKTASTQNNEPFF